MKVRSGFVSNSSSSSFIVAVDGETKTKVTLTIDVDLAKHGKTFKTIEELDKHYLSEWAYGCNTIEDWFAKYDDDTWAQNQYKRAKEAIENGKIVISGWFSDEDGDPIESMLCYSGLKGIVPDNIDIIHSEGGY